MKEQIITAMKTLKIDITEKQAEQFQTYMEELIEWNKKINLTAITDPKDIIIKHFVDSATILKHIKKGSKVIDIGTGAGFPGIPLKIIDPSLKITLVDSLNKRIKFLEQTIEKLNLKEIKAIHARAEELGRESNYREKYDVAVSRAVAKMRVLAEFSIPMVKVEGMAIFMKGSQIKEEQKEAENAVKVLGGTIKEINNFKLPNTDIARNNVIVEKQSKTQAKYPRKYKEIKNNPL